MDDYWKRELFYYSYGSVFNLRKKNYSSAQNPILRNIADCFETFIFCFTATNENFAKSFIFENPCLPFQPNRNNYLRQEFFTELEYENNKHLIRSLTMDQLLNPDFTLRSQQEFENTSHLIITPIKFEILRSMARNAVEKFQKVEQNYKRVDTVQNFCMRIKRGSKKYRKITTGTVPDIISTNIIRYAETIDQVINLESSKRLNRQWSGNFFDNSTRTFIFKLHNNLLGTNTRVAHFVRNHPRGCTFCTLSQDPHDMPETVSHLFFECTYVEGVLLLFYKWLLSDEGYELGRRDFFQGFEMNCPKKNLTLDYVGVIIKKYIWDCKLRFTIPNLQDMKSNFLDSYSTIYKISSKIRDTTNKSGIFTRHDNIHF